MPTRALSLIPRLFHGGLAVLAALLMVSCGGSQFAGGVGSGGSGVAEGAVSGFGSVIVDGVAYEDLQATVERDGEAGVAEAKLGQRVRITHEAGLASRILVLPQLIGVADSAPNAQGDFSVLGQRVRIVTAVSASEQPTVFDGLSSLRAGDAVEVHGAWSRSEGLPLLIASRIEKLAAAPDTVLLTATVLERTGSSLTLDDAARTELQVDLLPSSLQAGSLVRARLRRDALTQTVWRAVQVSDARPEPAANQSLSLNGVAQVDAVSPGRVRVQGLSVRLPGNSIPADGAPVQLQLRWQDGEWVAESQNDPVRDGLPGVRLKGVIAWNLSAGLLRVRGTTVSVQPLALAASCLGIAQGAETHVTVEARPGALGQAPAALSVDCSTSVQNGDVLEASGLLQQIQPNSVSVLVRGSVLTLSRTERSLVPRDLAALQGAKVELEYQRSGSAYLLRKLRPATND